MTHTAVAEPSLRQRASMGNALSGGSTLVMATGEVRVETVAPRKLAAVRREVQIRDIARAFKPALDEVWKFLGTQPGLRNEGHNLFLYHHGAGRNAPMTVDFGVEVTRSFDPAGEVFATETPAGQAAVALHTGSYASLVTTHDAIHAWCKAQGRVIAELSWELYGDWTDDESKLETTVFYLLK